MIPTSPKPDQGANGRGVSLIAVGCAQLLLWIAVAVVAERFDPSGSFERRPFFLVTGLIAANFLLYLAGVVLVWNTPNSSRTLRQQWRTVLLFAVLFRLVLWWSQPIQELDLYRYLWDGRVLAAGINPYRFSPAQVEAARGNVSADSELQKLRQLLHRAPEVEKVFGLIDHREVPTIYPPLSEAVFAATAFITPERAPVRVQVGMFKGVLLFFDFATVLLVMGLLRNLGQLPTRALAYAWCPLVLKEFANTGHLDAIAVCLTVAVFWLLTLPRRENLFAAAGNKSPQRPDSRDWLAAVLWAGAVLAKLYPLVLAPVLFAFWWRRVRWRVTELVAAIAIIVTGCCALSLPSSRTSGAEAAVVAGHSNFSGLGEFLRRWEMNDLLFSVVYENVRLRSPEQANQAPWYSILPGTLRIRLDKVTAKTTSLMGLDVPANRLAFLFTQALMAGTLFALACALALRRWPEDARPELLSRAFLCLAWLWLLSATQNPWYWTWALPLVVFASRPWLLVSGFALIYYLRFWFVHQFPDATLPGGFTGMKLFDEIVVWIEHLPPLLIVLLVHWHQQCKGRHSAVSGSPSNNHLDNAIRP